jgi:hypothetical protein
MFKAVKNIILIYPGDFAGNCVSFRGEQGIAKILPINCKAG